MKILITGSSGLVGQALVLFLMAQGHTIIRLGHTRPYASQDLEGVDAVIHLAGESITQRWTPEQKQKIRESRVNSTLSLANMMAQLSHPPKVLICASAIGFYGNRVDEPLTEASAPGHEFLSEVCQAWEAATQPAQAKDIRVVNLRFGIILSPKGGALKQMLPPFQLGMGGPLGSGKQIMSWISLEDVIGVIYHALFTESLTGPVNTVAPNPVTNSQFSKILGKVLFRPSFAPVPEFAVKLLFGEMGEALLLSSSQVVPQKLQASGYHFRHPQLEEALRSMLGKSIL